MPGKKGGGGASRRKAIGGSTPARTYVPSAGMKPAGTKRGDAQRRKAERARTPDQVRAGMARRRRRNG